MRKIKFWAFAAGAVLMVFAGILFTVKGFTDSPWYFAAAPLYVILAVSSGVTASRLRKA